MLAWVCDRCRALTDGSGRKNQRPDGWASVRLNAETGTKDVSNLICPDCLKSYQSWWEDRGSRKEKFRAWAAEQEIRETP